MESAVTDLKMCSVYYENDMTETCEGLHIIFRCGCWIWGILVLTAHDKFIVQVSIAPVFLIGNILWRVILLLYDTARFEVFMAVKI